MKTKRGYRIMIRDSRNPTLALYQDIVHTMDAAKRFAVAHLTDHSNVKLQSLRSYAQCLIFTPSGAVYMRAYPSGKWVRMMKGFSA